MKHEPLKYKRVICEDGYAYSFFSRSKDGDLFYAYDVKSAVEGLKDELLTAKSKFYKANKRETLSEYDEGYIDGSLDSLDGCLTLIDKWFQDVIE